mgnify:CR=1 FL=1
MPLCVDSAHHHSRLCQGAETRCQACFGHVLDWHAGKATPHMTSTWGCRDHGGSSSSSSSIGAMSTGHPGKDAGKPRGKWTSSRVTKAQWC